MIKILIVDDSSITRALLLQILRKNPEFQVIGMAFNGNDAVALTKLHNPDVIIMDINMPEMDGFEATKIIMKENPTPILIFTSEDVVRIGYAAIEAGAIDILAKPDMEQMDARFISLFLQKIESAAKANIKNKIQEEESFVKNKKQQFDIICIGASTGGPVAVQKVLQDLPSDIPVPILVTQHIDKNFDKHYVQWLNDSCNTKVQLASDGIIPMPGNVYVAPAEKHLTVCHVSGGKSVIRLTDDPPLHFLRPAVDKLFSSVAKIFKSRCLGVLLTGMGKDGAQGCVDILKNGGYTIAESERTCVIYGMPKVAVEIGGISTVLDIDEIANKIKELLQYDKSE